jgi:xanthine dehydrogenase YagS FAD-binding subunit
MNAILGTSASCIAVHPSDMCVALAILEAKVMWRARGRAQHRIC